MLSGSCVCGSVAYEVTAELGPIIHCHCRTCRKTHGAAFSSLASVPRSAFRLTAGEDRLGGFETSPGKFRRFCSTCGSHVFAERAGGPNVMLRLGCLDTPLAGKPLAHIWRSDAATWYDPSVALPEFPEGYDGGATRK
jgi:hypothetical protein